MPKDNTAYGPSSNPSSKSYAGGGGGGGVSTGKTTGGGNGGLGGLAKGLGITTGKTIFGNTAFGPAGGMAQGYATAQLGGGAGMKPTVNTYSNFRNLDGSATLPAAGNATAMGRNPQQALSLLQSMFGAPRRVGGLLDGEQVAQGPVSPPKKIVPTVMPVFNKYAALQAYRSPYGPEAYSTMGRLGQGVFNTNYGAWHDYYGNQPGNAGYNRGYGGSTPGMPAPTGQESITPRVR